MHTLFLLSMLYSSSYMLFILSRLPRTAVSMWASNNALFINTTSVNSNENLHLSSDNAETECATLDTFDFEAFFAESEDDLIIPVDCNLQSIDFAIVDHTFIDNRKYNKPSASENLGGGEHYEYPEHGDSKCSSVPVCLSPVDAPPSPYSYSPNTSPQLDKLEGEYTHVEQQRETTQALGDFSKRVLTPAFQSFLPKPKGITMSKSARTLNIVNFDSSRFYSPLAEPPKSWNPPHSPDTLFQYNAQGELDPQCAFSREQILKYLTHHPLHTFYQSLPSTKRSGLTLWIQTTPADASKRYPTKLSSKCRFSDCPAPNRSIRNGQFRVAFDEQSTFDKSSDPFHNAGYVHLFCLEKNFDFPRLCKRFNILGDDREIAEGRNKMAITRDHPAMLDIVNDFIQTSIPWGGKRPENWYEHSLSLALTRHHLGHQSKMRQRVRDTRDGNSIDRHLNNLDIMVEIREAIRSRRASEEKQPRNSRKRKASEIED
ncbi:hypothetical protein OIDMADRAFT_24492 [Oidiodendron maius Zn]|uniref:Uncharacterized protein n=1 Tax=Oidiodendron maius (strain Zn) TaxID=913774 RepID=A0A0C3DVQ9_OIDMZ|nr:hypothetical protein OIDMADRAFT_24492 [Oidiodendron maius Zn]